MDADHAIPLNVVRGGWADLHPPPNRSIDEVRVLLGPVPICA